METGGDETQIGLFAFPTQSNLNGRRLPLGPSAQLRDRPSKGHQQHFSLLDAAALASTAALDFSDTQSAPDFTALSLYKIFGFLDLGALIVRRSSSSVLQRRKFFGDGTVDMVINATDRCEIWTAKKQSLHEMLEDGTLPFHSIIALDSALSTHARLYGNMGNISRHTCMLSKVLYDGIKALKHYNGTALGKMYTPDGAAYGDGQRQGPIIAFNIQDSRGK